MPVEPVALIVEQPTLVIVEVAVEPTVVLPGHAALIVEPTLVSVEMPVEVSFRPIRPLPGA